MNRSLTCSLAFLLVAFVAGLALAADPAVATGAKPSILMFLVDDMGWQDTSVPFHKRCTPLNGKFRTPNMERLAASGVKFTQAYACSVCSPTRVSLITGMNAARHRVTNWTLNKDKSTDAKHPTLDFPAWNVNGMCAEPGVERTTVATPLPILLRQAGYRTIHVGKAHFGAVDTPGADPRNLGFDVNIAGHAAGGPGSYLGQQNFSGQWRGAPSVWNVPGLGQYHGKDIFLTEALTIEACKAMDRAVADRKPFFLYMAHYAVHVPFAEDKRYYQKYRDAGLDHTEAMYAALVEGMDKSLGDLLANLDRHGIADKTIVLFMSDNGGLSVHGRGGTPNTHNAPLSSGKGSAHEGGIRVPMIVRWPGVAEPASTCHRPVIIEDFFPTILEMAGVKATKTQQRVDGVSFVPLLSRTSAQPKERAFYWHYPNNWGPKGPGIGASSTIRKGDWKLIYYHADQHYELFNIADDLGETQNLAGRQTQRVADLAGELRRHLESVDAQMPIDKATGKPVPLPGAPPSSDTLNLGALVQPLATHSIYSDADFHCWCPNIVKGDDGRYYLIYSRWPKATKDRGWLTDSEIAVAVADKAEGPYRHVKVLLKGAGPGHWDELTAHNPKLYKFGDKYYLYYISSRQGPTFGHIRDSQRIGVAVADAILGPYRRCDRPLLEPAAPIHNIAVNPAVTTTPDGRYLMIVKGDLQAKQPEERMGQRIQAVALADAPTGPFRLLPKPALADIDTEDAAVWYDRERKRFYAIFHAHQYLGLITSDDGVQWQRARHYEVTRKSLRRADGPPLEPSRLERPDVFFDSGQPRVLCAGAKVGADYLCVLMPLKNNAARKPPTDGR